MFSIIVLIVVMLVLVVCRVVLVEFGEVMVFMLSRCSGLVCGCRIRLISVLLWIWVSLFSFVGGVWC